jgi:hypothetical protein
MFAPAHKFGSSSHHTENTKRSADRGIPFHDGKMVAFPAFYPVDTNIWTGKVSFYEGCRRRVGCAPFRRCRVWWQDCLHVGIIVVARDELFRKDAIGSYTPPGVWKAQKRQRAKRVRENLLDFVSGSL